MYTCDITHVVTAEIYTTPLLLLIIILVAVDMMSALSRR
jgi:hypothetical protein